MCQVPALDLELRSPGMSSTYSFICLWLGSYRQQPSNTFIHNAVHDPAAIGTAWQALYSPHAIFMQIHVYLYVYIYIYIYIYIHKYSSTVGVWVGRSLLG